MRKLSSSGTVDTEIRLNRFRRYCRIENILIRNLLCEFVCTTFLLYTGCSINAQTILSRFQMNASVGLLIGWGICIIFAVQMGYNITGSHMNPAVSFFCWSFGQLSFVHFLLYSVIQIIGAFFGSFLTFILYYEKIQEFDGGIRQVQGPNATAGIFATYPGEHLSTIGCLFDQVCATAVLSIIIGIITEEKNHIPKPAQPPLFGAMIIAIGLGFGLNAGNAMNPARDLGPRLFTLVAGYGSEVFSYRNYNWFWVPIIGPMIGALIGSWLYHTLIGSQITDEAEEGLQKFMNKTISANSSCAEMKNFNEINSGYSNVALAENGNWTTLTAVKTNKSRAFPA